ncbi:lysozyme inhibitor LprI family protein [Shewanella woodyi]|uniref:Lysozyme inhibitor LprI-like N-terminal domain-containing protein n=1 Tax=Shewanella woodyi (strain ATCC 51908 / MS32) TaxID=392500 RepID=B1KFV2_SHEWM|nr:lysozyme inhibitor LprI family protein [Shewanella woodyi]ACA85268.1 hypothetical protein Swoo_0975 [Shewanella woodyi ATCC 51908]
MKKYLAPLIFLMFVNMAYGQQTFIGCDELWQTMSEMVQCQMKANQAKEQEISALINTIQSSFKVKKRSLSVLKSQEHWVNYVESECRSRMISGALSGTSNAARYHICRNEKLSSRLDELQKYHYCDDNGCPERYKNK